MCSERRLYVYGLLIFDKGVKVIKWEMDSFVKKWRWNNWKDGLLIFKWIRDRL